MTSLAPLGLLHQMEAGDLVFSARDPANAVFQLESGYVYLFKELPGGRRQILSLLSAGDYFGFPSPYRRDSSARGLTPITVREIPFDQLDHGHLEALSRSAENELNAAYERLIWLGRKTARERVASFLTDLAKRGLDIPLRTTWVADFLGLRIETVSRILHQMRRDGLILQAAITEQLMIPDPKALRQLTGGGCAFAT